MGDKKRIIMSRKTYRTSKDQSLFDEEFWRRAGHEAKFAASWEMVNEVRLIRGEKDVSQPRLQRSIQNIKRRRR